MFICEFKMFIHPAFSCCTYRDPCTSVNFKCDLDLSPIPPRLFLEPVTPGGGLFDPPSNFKTTKAIDMKL